MKFWCPVVELGSCPARAVLVATLPWLAPTGYAYAQNVVAYEIVDGREIPASLTGKPGDAEAGRQLYFDRQLTRCSGCHGSPDGPGAQADQDAVGAPSLSGVAGRLSEGAIRIWLVAPQVIRPGTRMPSYYSIGQRDDPADPRYGETLLTAAEIENLVAYLMRQTGPR